MNRQKVVCPKCGTRFVTEQILVNDFLNTPVVHRLVDELWEKLGRKPTVKEFLLAYEKNNKRKG